MGKAVEPVFAPLGFDWKINVGVISSFAAREVIVATLAIVYGIGEDAAEDEETLSATLRAQRHADGSPVFTTATALALLVFFVLAMQCLPTNVVTRRETGSWKWPALQFGYMTVLAWTAAFVVYQVVSVRVGLQGDGLTPRSRHPATHTTTPHTTSPTPATRPITAPPGATFSMNTTAASTAIHSRFITPSTSASAMSAQQHPRQ